MPVGPLVNVVDLHVSSGGKELAWRRDLERAPEVAITVPAGASSVDVDFDYVNAAGAGTWLGNAESSHTLILDWNRVVMYPLGVPVSALRVDARVKLARGWSQATALETVADRSAGGGTVDFRPVSLETLVDSPLIAGEHLRTYDLGTQRGARHFASVVADNAEDADVPPEVVDGWKRLVVEASALFGARHYDAYRFLVVVSDVVEDGEVGLEHHQSSLDGYRRRGLLDEDPRRTDFDLLPHELAHSWDGKHRRPRGLATADFQAPMHDELLWVYEGLTEYLGLVLSARSGLAPPADVESELAAFAAELGAPARQWRSLLDTAIASPLLREPPTRGKSLRRVQDYYTEGALIWLEADVIIRQQTHGARSLDDFCQRFFGGKDTGAVMRPYDLDEVLTTLNAVASHDWRAFFDARVYQVAPHVPLGGVEGAGWRLAYVAEKPDLLKPGGQPRARRLRELARLQREEGERRDRGRAQRQPGRQGGLLGGAKLVAVDGRKYDAQVMKDALARARTSTAPIELLVEADDAFRTVKVDWHGGERYPALERDPSKPDLLAKILAPRVVKLGGAK